MDSNGFTSIRIERSPRLQEHVISEALKTPSQTPRQTHRQTHRIDALPEDTRIDHIITYLVHRETQTKRYDIESSESWMETLANYIEFHTNIFHPLHTYKDVRILWKHMNDAHKDALYKDTVVTQTI